MTNPERLRAFEMRLDGATWAAIAAQLHYTPEAIQKDLAACIRSAPHRIQCVYPAIRQAISQRYGTIRAFSEQTGLSPNTLYYILSGRVNRPRKDAADAILLATGLTYEEAFRREED
jgi:DNA-binding phage protein